MTLTCAGGQLNGIGIHADMASGHMGALGVANDA